MPELLVLVPTRGRPEALAELVSAVQDTTGGRARVLAMVDNDDPRREDYYRVAIGFGAGPEPSHRRPPMLLADGPGNTLSGWTNWAARLNSCCNGWHGRYFASLGDDHRPRTQDWDLACIEAIEAMPGPGWAYGDDGYQHETVPTAWVQSAQLVDALGWMMPPGCAHYFVDNAVRDLAQRAGRLAYLPDVHIEHLHPAADKAAYDSTYARAMPLSDADHVAYTDWRVHHLDADAGIVRALLHERSA